MADAKLTPEARAESVLDEYRKRCNLPSDWRGWVGTEIIADAIREAELAAEARGFAACRDRFEQEALKCADKWEAKAQAENNSVFAGAALAWHGAAILISTFTPKATP